MERWDEEDKGGDSHLSSGFSDGRDVSDRMVMHRAFVDGSKSARRNAEVRAMR